MPPSGSLSDDLLPEPGLLEPGLLEPELLPEQVPGYASGVFVEPEGDLDNFQDVDGHLFRGARPTERGIAKLKAMGIKTVINLENMPRKIRQGRRWAQASGLRYLSLPMNIFTPPTLRKAEYFLKLVTDPENQPVYIHCMQGRDRTGTMAYVYRVRVCGWDHARAYAEMKRLGFHTYLLGLKGFVLWYGRRFGRKRRLAVPAVGAEPGASL